MERDTPASDDIAPLQDSPSPDGDPSPEDADPPEDGVSPLVLPVVVTLLVDGLVLLPLIVERAQEGRGIVVGLLFGQVALVSIWVALGRAAVLIRGLVWVLVICSGGLLISQMEIRAETFTILFTHGIGVTAMCGLLRLFGWQWTITPIEAPLPEESVPPIEETETPLEAEAAMPAEEQPGDASQAAPFFEPATAELGDRQFSLANLLGWTTVLAVLAFLARFAAFPTHETGFMIAMLSASGLMAVATAYVAGARHGLGWRLAGLLVAGILVGQVVNGFGPDLSGDGLQLAVLYIVQTLLLWLWFGVTRAYGAGIQRVSR